MDIPHIDTALQQSAVHIARFQFTLQLQGDYNTNMVAVTASMTMGIE